MEPPAGGDAETLKDAQTALFRADRPGRPGALRARPVRRLPRRSTASPPTRPPRRTPRCGSTSRTGAGPACRSSSAPASGSRSPRPRCGSCSSSRRGSASRCVDARPRPEPARDQARSRRPASGSCSTRIGPTPRTARRRSTLDMEFAEQGGEGATPYEVLLHAAMRGRERRASRGRTASSETWRIMQPLLDAPPPGAAVRARVVGPGRGRRARRGPRPLARTLDRVVSEPSRHRASSRQSAAAPSPFTPIADYAFLSNCHTGALVAPDGAIDWLCVPRFDSPSVFGSLLDREAGVFRFGAVRHQPPDGAARTSPEPTSSMTTWKTPTGWVVVRDALTMGPRDHEDEITPHTRPPADDDADHMLVRTVECLDGRVEVELVCEPVFDYGREAGGSGRWSTASRHAADATGAGQTIRLQTDLALGIEGRPRAGTARARGRATGRTARCRGRRSSPRPPTSTTPKRGSPTTDRFWRALARPRPHPRSPLARPDPALGARDQGADLHADRRDGRGADDVAARDAGRRAQLGLPLHVDARHDVHAPGAPLPEPRLGSRRVHAVRRRRRAERGRRAADHVRDRRPPRPDRVDARRPLGLRGRASGADRQRRLRPASERRLRRRARLDPPPHAPQQAAPAPALADRPGAGRVRDGGLAEPGPGHLGGARRAAALRLLEAHVLGRARPRGEARRDPRRPGAAGDVARDGRGDPRGHPRARRQRPRRPPPALRDRLARRLDAAGGDLRVPARRRRAPARDRARDRGRADRGRLRPPLPHRGDRRRPLRQGGDVPHLLLLARVGARDRRRACSGRAT